MERKLASFRADGLQRLVDPDASPVYAELVRIARALHRTGCRVMGLWPAGPSVPVPPLAVRLAVALSDVSGASTAVVDGSLRWPSSVLADGESSEHLKLATHWLRPGVALVAPRQPSATGSSVPQLRAMLRAAGDRFAHLVIDLTGDAEVGDHLEVVDITDGVLLVARAGQTKEGDLLRMAAELPEGKNLGVVLVG